MKKILWSTVLLLFLILYLTLGSHFNILIPCPIKLITGLYCPGCGVTRMLIAILKGDFYGAFRYNPLLFISLPFFTFYYIESNLRKDYSIFYNHEKTLWIVLIIIFLVYGILRNISAFNYLIPTPID